MPRATKPTDSTVAPPTKKRTRPAYSILPGTPKAMQLTDAYVRALKPFPGDDRDEQFFGLGFGMRFTWRTKSWVYSYRVAQPGGKKRQRLMLLDHYPDMSLAEARNQHSLAWTRVDSGGDPMADGQAAKARAAVAALAVHAERGKTLRQVFEHYMCVCLKKSAAGGRKDDGAWVRAEFAKHIFPKLGDRPLREIRRVEYLHIIDGLKNGKPSAAFHLFRDLRQFLNWAVRYEEIEKNPFTGYKTVEVVGAPTKGERALLDWEISRFYRQLPLVGLQEMTKLALKFMLATGARSANVVGLPKSELSADGTMWVISRDRFKGGKKQHEVPLSKHAQRIIQEAARYNHGSKFVFPSPMNKPATDGVSALEDHILERSVSQALRKKQGEPRAMDEEPEPGKFGLIKFRPHDLRRSCRTGIARIGFDDGIAKKVIGHVLGGMDLIYNRHDYMNERRAALEAWGEHLDKLS